MPVFKSKELQNNEDKLTTQMMTSSVILNYVYELSIPVKPGPKLA